MVKIIRATTLSQIEALYEHLVLDSPKDRPGFIRSLTKALLEAPEALFVVQALREDEVCGFVIANNPPGENFVWLAQAWSQPGNDLAIADAMWLRLQLWCTALGKNAIRAESAREISVLHRRFGFEEVKKTIEATLAPDLLSRLAEAMEVVNVG